MYDDECDVAAWAASERRLADEVSGAIRQVYVAHCLRPAVPPRHLRELKEAGEAILGGERLTPAKGLLGEDVLALDRGHFSVLVSAGFEA